MRTKRLAATCASALAIAANLVTLPTPAVADAAQILWSREVTEFPVDDMLTQVNGDLTAGKCSSNPTGSLTIKDYPASGSTVVAGRAIPVASVPKPAFCASNQLTVIDKNGDIYTIANDINSRLQIVAYKESTKKWLLSFLPQNCMSTNNFKIGADGNFYAVFTRCGSNNNETRLIGFKPNAESGKSAPTQILNIQIDKQNRLFRDISVYKDGFAVLYEQGVQYLSYSGIDKGFVAITDLGYTWSFSTTVEGRSFVPIRSQQTSACPSLSAAPLKSIVAIEPTGQRWVYPMPACTAVHTIRPSYHGGAVLAAHTNNGTINQQYITSISQFGQLLWNKPYTSPGGIFVPQITTTLSGDVVLQGIYKLNNRSGVKFGVLSGITGAEVKSFDFYNASGDNYGYAQTSNSTGVTIAKNRAYLALTKCNMYGCGHTPTIYAFNIPGMQIDYPRGEILQAGQPEKTLVALGDSYSSGQGAGKYKEGTEASGPPGNNCRQSEAAYAHLLDKSPTAKLKLTAFKACGGATTVDVINGRKVGSWIEKPEQLSALSQSTDVVTITIGGNDAGFEEFVKACIFAQCEGKAKNDAIHLITHTLPARLDNLFAKIKHKVRLDSQVLVLGYPKLIENTAYTAHYCAYLKSEEKLAIKELTLKLNQALVAAVQRAGNSFRFIDPTAINSPFKGRELCEEIGFFNGVVAPPNNSASFHPKDKGQEAYKQLVEKHLLN